MKYVAFLRGINVGGNHKVPMGDLKKSLEEAGFSDIKTLLNSGNVVFSSTEETVSSIKKTIEGQLEKIFGWKIETLIRSQKEIQEMVSKDPFRNIEVTPQTRLYVTFFSDAPTSGLKIPYESPEKNFTILQVSNNAIFSVLLLSEKFNTTDVMKIVGKEYGKNVTTRN